MWILSSETNALSMLPEGARKFSAAAEAALPTGWAHPVGGTLGRDLRGRRIGMAGGDVVGGMVLILSIKIYGWGL